MTQQTQSIYDVLEVQEKVWLPSLTHQQLQLKGLFCFGASEVGLIIRLYPNRVSGSLEGGVKLLQTSSQLQKAEPTALTTSRNYGEHQPRDSCKLLKIEGS